jgi:hypothetical protein
VAGKPSGAKGIFLDFDASVRSDVTAGEWEGGVIDTIQDLMLPPCQSSQAVLDAIGRAGKAVTLTPERQPLLPGKGDANAQADPIDPRCSDKIWRHSRSSSEPACSGHRRRQRCGSQVHRAGLGAVLGNGIAQGRGRNTAA